jgi:hypothetical protein
MQHEANLFLLLGAILSMVAAVLHFACIFWGEEGFRVMGAGERVVRLAAQNHWRAKGIAFAIGLVLVIWSIFALLASGIGPQIPGTKWVVLLITLVYLIRAAAFPWLKSIIRGNSNWFWLVSSLLCLLFGVVHGVGLAQVW